MFFLMLNKSYKLDLVVDDCASFTQFIYMTFSDDDLELKSFEYIAVDCSFCFLRICDLQLL